MRGSTRWRLIEYAQNSASMNMAIDEAVRESVGLGADPTIRFYGWSPSAISIGYFQCISDEVDAQRCIESGVDVVRRQTGGGAVYHDSAGEITYSVIAKEALFSKDILSSYREICGWITDSLSMLGIEAEFKPINDIVVKGKKISGNAQTRRGGVLLQHGTILYSVDADRMFSVLKVPDEKLKDKLISAAKDRVSSVSQQRNVSWQQTYEAMVSGFTAGKDFYLGALSAKEARRAAVLAKGRYASNEWNSMR